MNRQEYILNRLPIGLVTLDEEYRVTAFSGSAAAVFGEERLRECLGQPIQESHPPYARSKMEWLLRELREAGASGYASMLINVPDRVLQLRMVKLNNGIGGAGYCLVMYDITDLTSAPTDAAHATVPAPPPAAVPPAMPAEANSSRALYKLPVSMQGRIALIDIEQVAFLRADGHYTEIHVDGKNHLCGLAISQIEPRLPEDRFLRVHRSYIVNLTHAAAVSKRADQLVILIAGTAKQEVPVSRAHAARLRDLLGL